MHLLKVIHTSFAFDTALGDGDVTDEAGITDDCDVTDVFGVTDDKNFQHSSMCSLTTV